MELDFNKIIRLKKIRIEKSELSEEENALTAPILKDKSLIHEIYKTLIPQHYYKIFFLST